MANLVKTSAGLVRRRVHDEYAVVCLNSGRFYFFSADMEAFLDALRPGAEWEQLLFRDSSEQAAQRFIEFLIDSEILEENPGPKTSLGTIAYEGPLPALLREAKETIDDVSLPHF